MFLSTGSMANARKEAKRHRILAICNMYEFEGKRTDEIAEKLNISEAEVVNTLEDHGIALSSRW